MLTVHAACTAFSSGTLAHGACPLGLFIAPTYTDLENATIFTAMGISPRTVFDIENRPFYATQDGLGRPVKELFG